MRFKGQKYACVIVPNTHKVQHVIVAESFRHYGWRRLDTHRIAVTDGHLLRHLFSYEAVQRGDAQFVS